MKLLNIALLLVAIQSDGKSGAGLTTVDAATPYLRADVHVEENPEDTTGEGEILTSPDCELYVNEAFQELEKLLNEESVGDLIKFMCNKVAFDVAMDRSAQAQAAVTTETNPCANALEQKIADAAPVLETYANSMAACVQGVTGEYNAYKGGKSVVNCCETLTVNTNGGNWSDKNLKTNINFVGMSAWGIPTYTFKYREGVKNFSGGALDTESTYFGAMAQDLLELAPEAVRKSEVNGYYAVDYSKIDVDFYKIA